MAKIALTVARNEDDTPLSPFFGKASWLLVVDPATGCKSYIRNRGWTSEWMCATALAYAVEGLGCAFVDRAALARLPRRSECLRVAVWVCHAVHLTDTVRRILRPRRAGGLDHCHDTGLECFGQRRPRLHQLLQVVRLLLLACRGARCRRPVRCMVSGGGGPGRLAASRGSLLRLGLILRTGRLASRRGLPAGKPAPAR